jgi:ankyrin repeat protein
LPNSDEVPSAQSLQKNEQVVIPVSCCFGWCNGSNETATTINTDLVIAIQNGSLDQVKQLLDVDGLDVNLREANGLSYFHTAVFNNQVEVAKCLLSKGAEVGVLGGEVKSTPLHVAAEKGYFEVCDKII